MIKHLLCTCLGQMGRETNNISIANNDCVSDKGTNQIRTVMNRESGYICKGQLNIKPVTARLCSRPYIHFLIDFITIWEERFQYSYFIDEKTKVCLDPAGVLSTTLSYSHVNVQDLLGSSSEERQGGVCDPKRHRESSTAADADFVLLEAYRI